METKDITSLIQIIRRHDGTDTVHCVLSVRFEGFYDETGMIIASYLNGMELVSPGSTAMSPKQTSGASDLSARLVNLLTTSTDDSGACGIEPSDRRCEFGGTNNIYRIILDEDKKKIIFEMHGHHPCRSNGYFETDTMGAIFTLTYSGTPKEFFERFSTEHYRTYSLERVSHKQPSRFPTKDLTEDRKDLLAKMKWLAGNFTKEDFGYEGRSKRETMVAYLDGLVYP